MSEKAAAPVVPAEHNIPKWLHGKCWTCGEAENAICHQQGRLQHDDPLWHVFDPVVPAERPHQQETKDEAARVAPSVPCVAAAGSTAETRTGAVTADERTARIAEIRRRHHEGASRYPLALHAKVITGGFATWAHQDRGYLLELIAEIERLPAASAADRVSALTSKMEWQPIESAPKDGTRILMFVPAQHMNEQFIDIAVWVSGQDDSGDYKFWSYGFGYLTHVDPTHWMPLPDPPTAALLDPAERPAPDPKN